MDPLCTGSWTSAFSIVSRMGLRLAWEAAANGAILQATSMLTQNSKLALSLSRVYDVHYNEPATTLSRTTRAKLCESQSSDGAEQERHGAPKLRALGFRRVAKPASAGDVKSETRGLNLFFT